MTPEEQVNYDASIAVVECYNNDIERMIDLYTEDCTFTLMGSGQVIRGREDLRKFEHDTIEVFPIRNLTVSNRRATGDTVLCEGVFRGTNAEGVEVTGDVCGVWTFRDGLVLTDRAYVCTAPQAGIDVISTILTADTSS